MKGSLCPVPFDLKNDNQHPFEILWIPNNFTYKYQVTSQFPSLEVFTSLEVVGMAIVRHEKERSIKISILKETAMKGVRTRVFLLAGIKV